MSRLYRRREAQTVGINDDSWSGHSSLGNQRCGGRNGGTARDRTSEADRGTGGDDAGVIVA